MSSCSPAGLLQSSCPSSLFSSSIVLKTTPALLLGYGSLSSFSVARKSFVFLLSSFSSLPSQHDNSFFSASSSFSPFSRRNFSSSFSKTPPSKCRGFVDSRIIHVFGGRGGAGGCTYTRHTKHIMVGPGWPSGGKGGDGGSVIIQVDSAKRSSSLTSSLSLERKKEERQEAENDSFLSKPRKANSPCVQVSSRSSSPPPYHLKILSRAKNTSIQSTHRHTTIPVGDSPTSISKIPSSHLSSPLSTPTEGLVSLQVLPSPSSVSSIPRTSSNEKKEQLSLPLSSSSVSSQNSSLPSPSSSCLSSSSSWSSSPSFVVESSAPTLRRLSRGLLLRLQESVSSSEDLSAALHPPSHPHDIRDKTSKSLPTTSNYLHSREGAEERGREKESEGASGGGLAHLPGWARGEDGTCGGKAHRPGRRGKDAVLTVPPGCVVWEVLVEGKNEMLDEDAEEEQEEGGGKEEEEEGDDHDMTATSCLPSRKKHSSSSLQERLLPCRRRIFLGDLSSSTSPPLIVARGGRGGRGNSMANPHTAELGEDGEEKWIEIELKSMADIGLIGFPNAGKSSLLAALSRCSPRIAPYPFTTLSPNIGRVFFANGDCISIADLPGLIENAHLNEGLGHAFLRHAERTAILAYVIDISGQSSTEIDEEPTDSKDRGVEDTSNERQVKHREEEEDVVPEVRKKRTSWRSGMPRIPRDPMETFFALFREVCMYSRTLASRPFLIIATKCDVRPEESLRSVDQLWKALNSTRTREKLQQLLTEEKARDYDRLQSPISAADSSSKDNKGRDELLSQSDHFFAAFSSSSPDKIRDCETHGKCMQMKRLTRKEVEGESQQETKGDEEVFAQKKETERERQRNPREHQMIHQSLYKTIENDGDQRVKKSHKEPLVHVVPVSSRCGYGLEYLADVLKKQLKENEKYRETILKHQVDEWIRRGECSS